MANEQSVQLPSGTTASSYQDLCILGRPVLQMPHQVHQFRFFGATLVLVYAGQVNLTSQNQAPLQLTAGPRLLAIAANTCSDIRKTPEENAEFRSLYLTFSESLISEFHQQHQNLIRTLPALQGCQLVNIDTDLQDTLEFCLQGLLSKQLSQAGRKHRLLGLLLALAERGILFMPRPSDFISQRLTQLLSANPSHAWTAANASAELAMSEATLRRRLQEEDLSFRALLQEIRMHHAMALLQTTRWSIPQIADACGYRASSRFSLRFKARFGISPATIR